MSRRHRHFLGLLLGGAIGTALTVATGLGLLWSVIAGAGVWAAVVMATGAPRRPGGRGSASLRGTHPRIAEELSEAQDRIKQIRRVAWNLDSVALRDSLLRVSDAAKAICEDVGRNPDDYGRVRKALRHYLSHTAEIADRLAYMGRVGSADPALRERTERTIADLDTVFQGYRDRMVEDETFDIEARLTLLETEIKGETDRTATMGTEWSQPTR